MALVSVELETLVSQPGGHYKILLVVLFARVLNELFSSEMLARQKWYSETISPNFHSDSPNEKKRHLRQIVTVVSL